MVACVSKKTKRWFVRLGVSLAASPLILFVFGILSPAPAYAEEAAEQVQEPSAPPESQTPTNNSSSDSSTVVPKNTDANTGGESDSTANATEESNASKEVIQPAESEVDTQSTNEEKAPTEATVVSKEQGLQEPQGTEATQQNILGGYLVD